MKKDYLGEHFWIKNPEVAIEVNDPDFFDNDPIDRMIIKTWTGIIAVPVIIIATIYIACSNILWMQAKIEAGLASAILSGTFLDVNAVILQGILIVFTVIYYFFSSRRIDRAAEYTDLGYLPF